MADDEPNVTGGAPGNIEPGDAGLVLGAQRALLLESEGAVGQAVAHAGHAVDDEAQNAQGIRAAVDQVSHQPEPVFGGIEFKQVQEAAQGIVTTLDVAYGVSSHEECGSW